VHCQSVTLPQVETTYRHVGSQPYWCWGYEHGFNEHRVVIGNEALYSKLPVAPEGRLVGMEILRLALERARTASEAVSVITELIGHYGQGKFANTAGVRTYDNGYIVADPHEAYVIETAGHEWAVKHVKRTAGISNVYSVTTDWDRLSPTAAQSAMQQGWSQPLAERFDFGEAYTLTNRSEGSGALRRQRSCALLGMAAGNIDAETMMALLKDHSNGHSPQEPLQTTIAPHVSICMHSSPDGATGNTAASLVADLCADGSRLPVYWCSFYSPCVSVFFPIFSEGALPPVLAIGGATPNDESPWWIFHRLTRLVQADPAKRASQVRASWQTVQERFLATAYDLAYDSRELGEQGKTAGCRAGRRAAGCLAPVNREQHKDIARGR
jgi:dipeptidase